LSALNVIGRQKELGAAGLQWNTVPYSYHACT